MSSKIEIYKCTQPCGNCPYRTDAPLRLWAVEEYIKLLEMEKSQFGANYACHKANGSVCVGWLMKQDENRFPSILLRLSLSKNNVTRQYLDSLNSPSPLYKNVEEMVRANYPEIKLK